MKIFVHDHKQVKIRVVVPVNIKDLSSDFEKVTVRLLRIKNSSSFNKQLQSTKKYELTKKSGVQPGRLAWHNIFNRLLADTLLEQPSQKQLSKRISDPEKKSSRTIEIKLTIPTLPKISSRVDIKVALASVKQKVAKSSVRTRVAILIILAMIGFGCYVLAFPESNVTATAPSGAERSHSPTSLLEKGTPDYATVLPAGKSITELGGWTRVSPKTSNPVYAYVDKIGNVQVDVSEQPLPPAFQTDTEKKVAQLAQSFNATEKIPAGSTDLYIATLGDDSQSVILSKNKLLILIKSVSLLPASKWVQYAESLK